MIILIVLSFFHIIPSKIKCYFGKILRFKDKLQSHSAVRPQHDHVPKVRYENEALNLAAS